MRATQEQEQTWIALLMAWIAGGVDAVGFLGLAHLFTAHMSGNSAALGASVGQADWREAARRALPIPAFVVGALTGAIVVDVSLRRKMRSPLRPAYALEAVLALAVLLWGCGSRGPTPDTAAYFGIAGLLALAMGIQNSTLRRAGKASVRTTFISGMLTNFAQEWAAACLWVWDRAWGRGARRGCLALRVIWRRQTGRNMRLFGGIWVCYIIGAIGGGLAQGHWHWYALALPLAGLAAILFAMQVWDIPGESPIEDKAKHL